MADSRRDDFLVGLTVIAVAVAVVAATLWVGQADTGRRRSRVEARVRDIGNVQVGDAVVLRGVRAGQVEGTELAPGGWVRMRFTLEPDIPLPPDPVVLLGSSSLLGEWQATILDRSALPDNPDLREAIQEASGEQGVMPGATLPDFEQLTEVAGRIAGDVAGVATRAQLAFDDSAARELRDTFRRLHALSGQLERTSRVQSRNLDTLATALRAGMARVDASAAALQRTLARADSATAGGELQATATDVRVAAAQLRATTAELQALVQRLGASQEGVGRIVARADSVAARLNGRDGSLGLLVNDPSLYTASDSLVRDLRALVADIRLNPKRYLSVRLF